MSASRSHTRRVRKAVAAVAALAALAVGVPLATATPAAAATCFGSACAGADPQATGCYSDGQIKDARDFHEDGLDLVIQLRYSPTCNAFWTRAVAGTGLSYDFGNTHYAQMRGYSPSNSSSLYYRYYTGIQRGTTTWTKMIPASYWGESCLVWPNPTSEPDSARWGCTPKR